jgi:hypothetical protein
VAKIKDRVDFLLDYPEADAMADRFKNYTKQLGLTIVVEDVVEYDTGENFHIIDEDEFSMRNAFVSTATLPQLMVASASAVRDLNLISGIFRVCP